MLVVAVVSIDFAAPHFEDLRDHVVKYWVGSKLLMRALVPTHKEVLFFALEVLLLIDHDSEKGKM